jgi:hypothetical protein
MSSDRRSNRCQRFRTFARNSTIRLFTFFLLFIVWCDCICESDSGWLTQRIASLVSYNQLRNVCEVCCITIVERRD